MIVKALVGFFILFFLTNYSALSEVKSCQVIDEAIKHAVKFRKLYQEDKIECHQVSKNTFLTLVSNLIKSDTDTSSLKAHGKVLYYQGLIDKNYNYEKCIIEALATNGAAFYSNKLKYIVVPNWIKTPKVILIHEVVHALQDQKFNTKNLASKKFIFDDENIAQGALLEGDAFYVEELFLQQYPHEPTDPDISGKIDITDKSCTLPTTLLNIFDRMYYEGAEYTKSINKNEPNKINYVLENPIKTTRAIVDRSISDLNINRGFKTTLSTSVVTGRIGVFGVQAFIAQILPGIKSERIGAKLNNDYFIYDKNGHYQAFYEFDDEQSSLQFFQTAINYWNKHLIQDKHNPFKFTSNELVMTWKRTSKRVEITATWILE
jgi:hypothetical protein